MSCFTPTASPVVFHGSQSHSVHVVVLLTSLSWLSGLTGACLARILMNADP
jgi:hypothetical protein